MTNEEINVLEKREGERLIMRELIDGCMEVVETWGTTEYQKKWAAEWVARARRILKQ
jgi:hypothetical protein